MGTDRFELSTSALSAHCSTTELCSQTGREYTPTMIDLATYAEASFDILRCGLVDSSFKLPFLGNPVVNIVSLFGAAVNPWSTDSHLSPK